MKNVTCLVALLGVAAGATLPAAAALQNEISLDFAVRSETEPTLDGRLDDAAWTKAVVHDRFYDYYKANPKLSANRSELRLLYTDSALWIGLRHYDSHMEGLKVLATARDSVGWHEDSDEVYVDPFGDAIGYTKLLVNAAGVIGDMRRIDGSVSLGEWSGLAWRAKTSVHGDRWEVEIRLPYSDLQKPPVPGGALWRLCVTRFSWTTGSFVGSVSSPNGSYNNTAGFGYLYFLKDGETPDAALAKRVLEGRVTPPWGLWLGTTLLTDRGEGVVTMTEEECRAAEEREERRRAEIHRRLKEEFGGRE